MSRTRPLGAAVAALVLALSGVAVAAADTNSVQLAGCCAYTPK